MSAVELRLVTDEAEPQCVEPVIVEALEQLAAYFEGTLAGGFSVPLRSAGTPFERRVWGALVAIPVGMTISYGRLAGQLGSSARAVAGACRANPWPLLVPCHRVVGAHGLGGYCGATDGPWLEVKRWLLRHEQALGHGKC
ncbi:MAG: methylated-DNA--[protein]-cysteine S-methyltransferase [Gammaproteobacteria bacterium]|nr:methylated-DNA--[protein]-cysteine S-methyltransferase [Gammaproteobacteria bacterium]